jgi:uncharacterized protein (UPF0332 family)
VKHEFLEKAKENLSAAETCFEKGLYNACANRAYYAAFQAAISALADQEIKRDRIDHKWVQAEFSGRLIKQRKIYPGRVKSNLADMQTVRNEADYEIQKVTGKVARKQLAGAREIVTLVSKELEK